MARPNTRGAQTVPGIQVTLTRDGESRGGHSAIFGKSGAIKAPLYLSVAECEAAGLDPTKPKIVTIVDA